MPKKQPKEPTLRGYYAGFVSRSLAWIIDLLILVFVLTIASTFLSLIGTFFSSLRLFSLGITINISYLRPILYAVAVFFVIAFYYIFFWFEIGTTIGGLIIGTKIVNRDGGKPSLFRAIARFIFEFCIPLFFVIGVIPVLFDSKRRALFDMIAGTYVIYNWDAKAESSLLKGVMDKITDKNT